MLRALVKENPFRHTRSSMQTENCAKIFRNKGDFSFLSRENHKIKKKVNSIFVFFIFRSVAGTERTPSKNNNKKIQVMFFLFWSCVVDPVFLCTSPTFFMTIHFYFSCFFFGSSFLLIPLFLHTPTSAICPRTLSRRFRFCYNLSFLFEFSDSCFFVFFCPDIWRDGRKNPHEAISTIPFSFRTTTQLDALSFSNFVPVFIFIFFFSFH